MRLPATNLSLFALTVFAIPAWAVDAAPTGGAYTGLGITPTAQILDWGQMATGYERQVAGNPARLDGHNMVLGFGLLPNFELTGRFATNSLHDNCFSDTGCGVRHLIAAGKTSFALDRANHWLVAAGAADVGGSSNYFRSYYGVVTYDDGPFQASGGAARRSGAGVNGSQSPLSGGFASVAWQPVPVFRGQLESSGRNAWAGVRLFAPREWLPTGWSLSIGANARLNNNPLTQRTWWNAALSIPLYKLPEMSTARQAASATPREVEAGALAPQWSQAAADARGKGLEVNPVPAPSTVVDGRTPDRVAVATEDDLRRLASALQNKGFEDIFVGRMPDGTVAIRVNNGSYRRNTVDGLGAALGVIARNLSETRSGYRLILTQRQIPFVAVTGQVDCLRQWIEQPSTTCTAGQLSTPGSGPLEPLHDGAVWVVEGQKPAWQSIRVKVGPVLRTKVGTEVGAVDLDVGVGVDAEFPLWRGASVDWGVNAPLAHSRNYEPNAAFGNLRIRSGTERLAFTQTARLPIDRLSSDTQTQLSAASVLGQLTAGRIGTFYDGVLGSVRWEPGDGRHRVSADAGIFRNNQYEGGFGPLGALRRATPVYASYRYSLMATRTDLEATAGQFMNNDRGFQLGMRQWFNDASVGLYYKRTTDYGRGQTHQLLGLELSVKLGPRRDWQALPHVQIGGSDRFSHQLETSIRETGSNPLRLGRGVRAPTPDLNTVNNLDRSSLLYFEDNMPRIREAARS